ncbi:MAG: tail fiber domain-containing protein [Saprospiraceae bacterium]
MKTTFTTLLFVLLSVAVFAQAPESLNYQAVLRNSAGDISQNETVSVEFIIHSGSAAGPSVYAENHNATTNEYGLVNLQIGKGSTTAGNFANVDWAANKYFLETIIDGASAGTQEMVSVPYSLYAKRAGSADDDFDTDPANELQSLSINGNQMSLSGGGGSVTIPQTPSDWSKSGNNIYNNNTGNVGVGIENPDAKLHISTIGLTDTDNALRIGGNGKFSIDATGVVGGRMTVLQNGNVGVGTTSPDNVLQVQTKQGVGTPLVGDELPNAAGTLFAPDVWQSITAEQTGYMVSIDALFGGAGNNDPGVLYIYEGEGTSGKLLHSQAYPPIPDAFANWKSFSLTDPVFISMGTQYTIRFTNFRWVFTTDPYPGGRGNFAPSVDQCFKTYWVNNVENNTTLAIGNGRVGIGTNTPREKLEVVGNICHTGSISACSDRRYKTDFQAITNPLEKIQQLNGLYYNWKTEKFPDKQFTDERQIGVIAQEVEVLFPEIVLTDEQGFKSVDYSKLTPILLEAIKEQQQMIEQLQASNGEMASQIQTIQANLLSRLDALESRLVPTANVSQRVTNADE